MNGAVPLPLDLPELRVTATGDALVRRSVLPSGVRVLTERVPGARSATIGFWIAVGSRDEPDHGYGSTHFLEHLLFKGTATRGALEHLLFKGTARRSALDIAVSFDAVGGEHNALTAKEHTCYYAKVRDQDVAMAIDVLADMVVASRIDPTEFDTERGVILEELAMADDDPADVAGELLYATVFGAHPLGRPIGGTVDTIRAATHDDVVAHYRATHRPGTLVVTAAGAVDHDGTVARVVAALTDAGWNLDEPGTPEPRRDTTPVVLPPPPALAVRERDLEQVSLHVGTAGLPGGDPGRHALAVTNAVLGGGMSSRLFQEVRERRGLAYSVYSFAPGYSDAGLVGLSAGCAPARAADVAALMIAELERLAAHGVGDDELRRARGQLGGGAALALEDSDTRMNRLGRAELGLGEFVDLDESLRRLEAVTPAQVQQLAARFATAPRSIVAVGAVAPSVFAASVDPQTAA